MAEVALLELEFLGAVRLSVEVPLHAQDRLDASFQALLVERDVARYFLVVCDRCSWLTQLLGALSDALVGCLAVKEAIFRMYMKTYEVAHAASSLYFSSASC